MIELGDKPQTPSLTPDFELPNSRVPGTEDHQFSRARFNVSRFPRMLPRHSLLLFLVTRHPYHQNITSLGCIQHSLAGRGHPLQHKQRHWQDAGPSDTQSPQAPFGQAARDHLQPPNEALPQAPNLTLERRLSLPDARPLQSHPYRDQCAEEGFCVGERRANPSACICLRLKIPTKEKAAARPGVFQFSPALAQDRRTWVAKRRATPAMQPQHLPRRAHAPQPLRRRTGWKTR